jgi:NADH-quinone oxidoreductase subunit L
MALALPLIAGILAGFFGKSIGKLFTNSITIFGVFASFVISIYLLVTILETPSLIFNQNVYTWLEIGSYNFSIGLLVDNLTVSMMVVVNFISLMVHVYTIGYMHNDPGYHRFFCYISLFTFSMLSLVMANNFLQLFFGWEAVGVMSYLLIGFWYTKESAIKANFKAFIINRVGDMFLLLGIALLFSLFESLDYEQIFNNAVLIKSQTIMLSTSWEVSCLTLACLLLFGGAMGKSAQMPLHVWLPDSMEGPTPISALIHAATMVTAGVFMLARMSPLFELSATALSFVLIVGSVTAISTGLLGLVQYDIKRIIAYSTLSQLGYMVVAAGVSAYSASLFHLMTHAFFKALLFLAAGSVIVSLHHKQDIRNMGGLRSKLPITYITSLIGSLALIGFPGFSGFFSKDALIEAVSHSDIYASDFAYYCILIGVLVTSLYTFRLFFIVFHGPLKEENKNAKEPQLSILIPLILLAIPSMLIAWPTVGPMVFNDFFSNSIVQPASTELFGYQYTNSYHFLTHSLSGPVVYIAIFGIFAAYYLYRVKTELPDKLAIIFKPFYQVLINKYYFDYVYENVFARLFNQLGNSLWNLCDIKFIDNFIVNGTAKRVGYFSNKLRQLQTGYIYHYALMMALGLSVFLAWVILKSAGLMS